MAWEENSTGAAVGAQDALRGGRQSSEVGELLLSARAVSRQLIARAHTRADEIEKAAEERADGIISRAEEQADEIISRAEARAEEIVRGAEERAEEILGMAETKPETGETAWSTEPEPPVDIDTDGETAEAGPAEREARIAPMPADVTTEDAAARAQEYAARCVEACLSELRRRQEETIDYINEQWQQFLCGLMPGNDESETPAEAEAQPAAPEISQQEIEAKVNAIARELMEIIGK